MTVKIVTDSTSDLPSPVAQALGITVVPAYIHFGDKTYRDRVDISEDELYQRLVDGPVHPTTSAPSPGDFAEAYSRLAQESDEIVSIVVTSKQSAVYDSALLGKEAAGVKSRIEVIDSRSVTMGLGLMAIAAAKAAQAGKGIEEVVEVVRRAIPRTYGFAVLDTLKYALRGGRLSRAGALLGAMVMVKPMLIIKDGVVGPAGVARTRGKGIERLYEFVKKYLPIEDLAVVHATSQQEAENLAERIKPLTSEKKPLIARLGSALGVHGGPGALAVVLRTGKSEEEKVAEKEGKARRLSLPSLRLPRS
jgi:DegV family protein with EDD domain